jgi:FkbM family methyltransferase
MTDTTRAPLHRRLLDWINSRLIRPQRRFARTCYSQEGEDMILRRALNKRKHGFYVDVGAHHPFRFSNTYMLYKKGWRGINIDAMPGSMRLFDRYRPRDINLETAVAETPGKLIFYLFADPAVNTCDEQQAQESLRQGVPLVEKKQLRSRRLEDILDQHLPAATPIDVMSVDVEGLDLQVLKSNDWTRYRPRLLLVERLDLPFPDLLEDELYLYLKEQQYELYARTVNTLFFQDRSVDATAASQHD